MAQPTTLEDIDDDIVHRLGQVLWSWECCASCYDRSEQRRISPVTVSACQKSHRLGRFLQFYTTIVSDYTDGTLVSSRAEFFRLAFPQRDNQPPPNAIDLHNATTLAVRVLITIESSALHQLSYRLERGGFRLHWNDEVAFSRYLQDLFPIENHPILSYGDNELFLDMKSELRAAKLKKRLWLSFRAAHDIRNHLYFDRKANVLEIFHHTAFLKEQLRATKDNGDFFSPVCDGALPRQLVLEALDSIQGMLFPLSEPKSKRLLQSLVRSCSFDPDIVNFEYSSIQRLGEDNIRYVYLADRLSDLYNEVRNPTPRGWIERQMERKSSARYMMMATLIGIVFAVLLGIAALALSEFQTWIGYQAWQHPVEPPSA
ncbi:hypothetical protein B0T17DRAFT_587998 [Bombardia bombarda]|uniref:Uncharacterized protein n=1 Tax=Bombardia bombarda TaxID=252184 RepID=A0AA40CG50_9PEZI|nr:hypothetical protein B0T17DRAFT_587998 [Bombardia bombarda]